MKRIAIYSAIGTLITLCACSVPTGEAGSPEDRAPSGDRGESAETVGSSSAALGLTVTLLSTSIHYGGTIGEEDHFVNVGSVCSDGYTRIDPPTVTHAGNGTCDFAGWVNPGNPHDCTAKVRLHHSALFLYGDCSVTILEERHGGSCRGRAHDLCGGPGSDGSCFCDPVCQTYGDCCADFASICT